MFETAALLGEDAILEAGFSKNAVAPETFPCFQSLLSHQHRESVRAVVRWLFEFCPGHQAMRPEDFVENTVATSQRVRWECFECRLEIYGQLAKPKE